MYTRIPERTHSMGITQGIGKKCKDSTYQRVKQGQQGNGYTRCTCNAKAKGKSQGNTAIDKNGCGQISVKFCVWSNPKKDGLKKHRTAQPGCSGNPFRKQLAAHIRIQLANYYIAESGLAEADSQIIPDYHGNNGYGNRKKCNAKRTVQSDFAGAG